MPPQQSSSKQDERKKGSCHFSSARTIETSCSARAHDFTTESVYRCEKEPLVSVCSREIERRVALRRASSTRRKREIFQDDREESFLFLLPVVRLCRFPLSPPSIFFHPFSLPVTYFVFFRRIRVCSKRVSSPA